MSILTGINHTTYATAPIFQESSHMRVWRVITIVESIVMMGGYSGLSMWQVGHWIDETRDANYSNPDDHPNETKESAAQASGFSSYNAYYRAKQKLKLQI